MKLNKWLRNKITALSIALSNVEKSTFSKKEDVLFEDTPYNQRHTQGTLADTLMKGEISQEVKNLRWRTYKILKASKGLSLSFDKTDNDGDAWYKAKRIEDSRLLNKVILDNHDSYPIEMVVTNEEIALSNLEAISEHFKHYDAPVINENKDDNTITASHGEINANEFFINNKPEKQIKVLRQIFPKFYIERFAKKLNIRTINDKEKLLEFYISKYPNEYDKTNKLFIKEILKLINNGTERINFIEIDNVEFTTENTLGSDDFLFYNYKINKFDKVIEFDGHYVIKFIGEVIVNGEDTLLKYIEPELEKKYENKDVKN